jgi:phospholipase D1/2
MPTDALSARRARRALLLIAVGLVLAAFLLWHVSPLGEMLSREQLAAWFDRYRAAPWAPFAVLLAYLAGGLIEFPVVLLIAATALLFEPAIAFAVALAGSLASALVFYAIGARLTRRTTHAALGGALERVQALLARGGIVPIVVLRSIPFAPFSVVNLAAGSIGVPLRDYLVGTALGLLPGIVVLTAFGERLRALWRDPTPANVALLVAIVLVWIVLVVAMQRLCARPKAGPATSNSSGAPGSAADKPALK